MCSCGVWAWVGVRCGLDFGFGVLRPWAWRTWRRPTVPRLEPQYHGRWRVSRPSSGWDRVGHSPPWPPGRPSPGFSGAEIRGAGLGCDGACMRCVRDGGRVRPGPGADRRWAGEAHHGGCPVGVPSWGEVYWGIRTGRLSALPRVYPRPIDVMVSHAPQGDLVLRRVSRLDAFSGYPSRAWLPGRAAGATTGAPEARPPRSSRTRGSASQVSNTHGR